jgi:hypothetical protein
MSDLAKLLDSIAAFVRSYVVLTDDQVSAVALWVFHTWAFEAADCTPYLRITSAEKESGKTRLLEVLSLLVREPVQTVNITDSALFRLIDGDVGPCVLFDEVDVLFGKDARDRVELVGLLNDGYKRGGFVYRVVGEGAKMRVKKFGLLPEGACRVGEGRVARHPRFALYHDQAKAQAAD